MILLYIYFIAIYNNFALIKAFMAPKIVMLIKMQIGYCAVHV